MEKNHDRENKVSNKLSSTLWFHFSMQRCQGYSPGNFSNLYQFHNSNV